MKGRDFMKCAICKEEAIPLNRRRVAYKEVVCEGCFQKANPTIKESFRPRALTVDELKKRIIDLVGEEVINFKATKTVNGIIRFDDDKKRILLEKRNVIYNYDDIQSFEVHRDDEVISGKGLDRAIAGGVLFGGIGAVVGAITARDKEKEYCSSLGIEMKIKDNGIYIPLIIKNTKIDSIAYESAFTNLHTIVTQLQSICRDKGEVVSPGNSVVEEMKQYKELLDIGVVTQEEFDKKKKELLGL